MKRRASYFNANVRLLTVKLHRNKDIENFFCTQLNQLNWILVDQRRLKTHESYDQEETCNIHFVFHRTAGIRLSTVHGYHRVWQQVSQKSLEHWRRTWVIFYSYSDANSPTDTEAADFQWPLTSSGAKILLLATKNQTYLVNIQISALGGKKKAEVTHRCFRHHFPLHI